jgi:hypothetical protein
MEEALSKGIDPKRVKELAEAYNVAEEEALELAIAEKKAAEA